MFGFGYKKRALAAEAKAKDFEAALAIVRRDRDSYRERWRAMVIGGGMNEVQASLSGHYVPPKPAQRTRTRDQYQPASSLAVSSASSYTGGGFDMTSAMLGGLAGYALVSNPHHSASPAPDTSPSFSSGGGGDYGGGGATSSWDSSSSSSSSDSSSSYDSGSCSSSSYSSD